MNGPSNSLKLLQQAAEGKSIESKILQIEKKVQENLQEALNPENTRSRASNSNLKQKLKNIDQIVPEKIKNQIRNSQIINISDSPQNLSYIIKHLYTSPKSYTFYIKENTSLYKIQTNQKKYFIKIVHNNTKSFISSIKSKQVHIKKPAKDSEPSNQIRLKKLFNKIFKNIGYTLKEKVDNKGYNTFKYQ